MVSNSVLGFLVLILIVWSIEATSNTLSIPTKYQHQDEKGFVVHRYLKGTTTVTTSLPGEERDLSIKFIKLKALLQKNIEANPALARSLEKVQKKVEANPALARRLGKMHKKLEDFLVFLDDNPTVKNEIIVGFSLLALIAFVPLIVSSYYPA